MQVSQPHGQPTQHQHQQQQQHPQYQMQSQHMQYGQNPPQVNTSYLNSNPSIPLNSYRYPTGPTPVPYNRGNSTAVQQKESDLFAKHEESPNAFIPGSGALNKPSLPQVQLPPRSHSADGAAQRSAPFPPLRAIQTSDHFLNTPESASPSPVTGKDGLPVPNMRPKLKVKIPLGESGDGQITSADNAKGGTLSEELERRSAAPKDIPSGPMSAGPLTGTNNSSSWANLLLPPPSPSSYLTSSIPIGGGPGNPFGRPPLVANNNGEQTPLSAAALPSRYVNELLPSPSNFYGGDWGLFGTSGSTSAGGNGVTSQGGHSSNLAGAGTTGGSSFLSQRNNHLSVDMLPSPLQFNTPVVASSSQSLTDNNTTNNNPNKSPPIVTTAGAEKRETTGITAAAPGPPSKRAKLDPSTSIGRRF